MLVLLALAGTGTWIALDRGLDSNIRAALNARADELATAVSAGARLEATRQGTLRLAEPDETFTQVIASDGRVLYQSGGAATESILSEAERERAAAGSIETVVAAVPGLDHRVRVVARQVSDEDQTVVVAAASLEDRDEAVALLARALAVGGPLAVGLAALLGYLLAAGALAPVDRMRREADQISGERSGLRLSRPLADDELRSLADTFNALLERIDAGRERERGFIADASHELRTPLGILTAEIELALAGERSPGELRAALTSAAEETDALAALTSDLLTLARVEDGRIPLRREHVEMAALVTAAADALRETAGADGREIAVDAPGPLWAEVDHRRIDQACRNLIGNALVHGEGRVAVSLTADADAIVIAVEDDGPGADPDVRDSVFERFSRAAAARGRPGSGLGLAIVRAIAQAHHGDVRLGAGSRVVLRIPRGPGPM